MTDPQSIIEEAERRKAVYDAQFIHNRERELQRKLAASTYQKRVHDIFDFTDKHGDDIITWIFAEPNNKDVKEGETVIAMIVFLHPTRQQIRLEKAVVRGGRYYHTDGGSEDLLVNKLMAGAIGS